MADFEGRRELHRFRRGESCDECGARRWYSESGFRYCENGHLIQDFVPFDQEDADNYGGGGHVARREREVREREARHLTGDAARELFLECLQLILRHQLSWLVREREHRLPAELEAVVRDLWDLRVRGFYGLRKVRAAGGAAGGSQGEDGGGESEGAGAEGLKLYSSQVEGDGDDSGSGRDGGSRSGVSRRSSSATRPAAARKWASGPGERWNMPGLFDTLGLCYLGCVLLRLPYRIGDFYRWARGNQILFLGAIDQVPKHMRDRLPGAYHRSLLARNAVFIGGELHDAVLELVRGYHANYGMEFPGLNAPLMLWQYSRELGLPVEVFSGVQELVDILQEDFRYPAEKRKVFWLDHPDICLLASIVFVTKLLHPFDGVKRYASTPGCLEVVQINWAEWRRVFAAGEQELGEDGGKRKLERRDLDKLRSEDAWHMSEEQMDDYMDWYQQVRLHGKEDPRHLAGLFPLEMRQSPATDRDAADEEQKLDELLRGMPSYLSGVEVRPAPGGAHHEADALRFGQNHPRYRKEKDLPDVAREFYSRAADLGGITVQALVGAVALLERRWLAWVKQESQVRARDADDKSPGFLE